MRRRGSQTPPSWREARGGAAEPFKAEGSAGKIVKRRAGTPAGAPACAASPPRSRDQEATCSWSRPSRPGLLVATARRGSGARGCTRGRSCASLDDLSGATFRLERLGRPAARFSPGGVRLPRRRIKLVAFRKGLRGAAAFATRSPDVFWICLKTIFLGLVGHFNRRRCRGSRFQPACVSRAIVARPGAATTRDSSHV